MLMFRYIGNKLLYTKPSLEHWQSGPRECIIYTAEGEVSSAALCLILFEIINCTLDKYGLIRINFLISSAAKTNTFEVTQKCLTAGCSWPCFQKC